MSGRTEFIKRYLSHSQLERIEKTRVGIAGAGGLGSNCAVNLVRCGFTRFVIADFDRVEPSNLNRQFFFADQIGREKVIALRENLERIAPLEEIKTLFVKISPENVKEIFADCGIIIEAFDNAESKSMLVNGLMSEDRFIVAASGVAGYGNSDRIKTRRINSGLVIVGDMETEVSGDNPPLSPRVNIAAAKMADAVLEFVLG